jgi:hypothetical protein
MVCLVRGGRGLTFTDANKTPNTQYTWTYPLEFVVKLSVSCRMLHKRITIALRLP